MDVEYLPFFEDEFFLRATDPSKWELIIAALRDIRESADEDANIRGYATLLSLLSLYSENADDDLIPIIARRFANDLLQARGQRAESALLALESAVAKHQFREDCPSVEECARKDALRKSFIESGKWTDVNVAYEHTLQKSVEQEQAIVRSRKRRVRVNQLISKIFTIPLLVFLPLGLFLALIVQYIIDMTFSGPFMIACAVLFSVEAASICLAFSGIVLNWEHLIPPNSLRVTAAVASLVLCVVSIVIAYRRSFIPNGYVSSGLCAPLALCQVFVGLVDWSLLKDFSKVRALNRAEG
jgi:hypothetical protein